MHGAKIASTVRRKIAYVATPTPIRRVGSIYCDRCNEILFQEHSIATSRELFVLATIVQQHWIQLSDCSFYRKKCPHSTLPCPIHYARTWSATVEHCSCSRAGHELCPVDSIRRHIIPYQFPMSMCVGVLALARECWRFTRSRVIGLRYAEIRYWRNCRVVTRHIVLLGRYWTGHITLHQQPHNQAFDCCTRETSFKQHVHISFRSTKPNRNYERTSLDHSHLLIRSWRTRTTPTTINQCVKTKAPTQTTIEIARHDNRNETVD